MININLNLYDVQSVIEAYNTLKEANIPIMPITPVIERKGVSSSLSLDEQENAAREEYRAVSGKRWRMLNEYIELGAKEDQNLRIQLIKEDIAKFTSDESKEQTVTYDEDRDVLA